MANEAAFKAWSRRLNEESGGEDPFLLPRLDMKCDRPGLSPTHPQMSRKRYHRVYIGNYDHFRLNGGDMACAISAKKADKRGKVYCLRPDTLVYALVSDTYQDSCGNRFRGYLERQFFRRNEKMETLFTPGRSLTLKPNGSFPDYLMDPTTFVAMDSFLFFTPLLPGDEAAIEGEREKALRDGFVVDPATGLFKRVR